MDKKTQYLISYGRKKVGPSRPIFFNFKGYYIPYMWR